MQEAKETQQKALADLREAFKALSSDALKETAPEFLRLAKETFGKFQESAKGDLDKRQESIKTLVKPLEEQLKIYQQRLQQSEIGAIHNSGRGEEAAGDPWRTKARHWRRKRSNSGCVLKSNQARGRWGEETLRRVVEAAGMSAHCDFSEQTQAGDGKPDLVVRLPGDRLIIVDAKVPDLDFLGALESADPAKRAESLAHARGQAQRDDQSAGRPGLPRPVSQCAGSCGAVSPRRIAFQRGPGRRSRSDRLGGGQRILLATPASLIALLRSVSVSWQQHAQTENAQKIAEAAREFYSRVVTFTKHFERIRAGLEGANAAFNDAAASFQTRVRPAGERLAELGGGG